MSDGALPPEDRKTKESLPALTGLLGRLRRRRRRPSMTPHPGSTDGEQVMTGKSGALRAAIFGINDGLVSNVSLIMGVAGAAQSNDVILLSGIAGLLAGAFSMGAGEYISMKVQREVFERLIHLEAHEIASMPEEETIELAHLYERKGVPAALAMELSHTLMADPKVALETHTREELGLDPEAGLGSPWGAAVSSFLTFSFGAIVPLVPFLFTSGTAAVVLAGVLSAIMLTAVGAAMSLVTGRNPVVSALRQLGVGVLAAGITYGVGVFLGFTVTG
ncbi:MAG: VIT1/CCC1 transporter family protein [Actinomycetota bacterium]